MRLTMRGLLKSAVVTAALWRIISFDAAERLIRSLWLRGA